MGPLARDVEFGVEPLALPMGDESEGFNLGMQAFIPHPLHRRLVNIVMYPANDGASPVIWEAIHAQGHALKMVLKMAHPPGHHDLGAAHGLASADISHYYSPAAPAWKGTHRWLIQHSMRRLASFLLNGAKFP
jgi:hypothetical protein